MNNQIIRKTHPGEILLEELLIPQGITRAKLAKDINVSTRRINDICLGKRSITPDTALRLAIYFNLGQDGVNFWMNLQHNYDKFCWERQLAQQEQQIRSEIQVLTT